VLLPTPASPPERTTQPATRPPPEDPVQLPEPGVATGVRPAPTSAKRTGTGARVAPPAFRGKAETWPRCLIDGVPVAAAQAPAQPPERHVSALPADEGALAPRQGPLRLLGLARYEDVRRAEDDLADRQVIVFAV
jgi:hypothetical protein